MTSYLVLFWYLSPRNSSIYSDPSVWGGSFTDEVRPLTAMKQYLKQIKRHFPKLDSCCFQLTQVLHLTTERRGKKNKRSCICLGGTKKHSSLGGVCFGVFFCQLPKSPAFSDRHFRFLIDFFLPSDICATMFHIKIDVKDCAKTKHEKNYIRNRQTLLVCRVWLFQLVSIPA